MTLTPFRLAFAGIRSRLLAATLTVMIAAAAAATLVIALEVRGSGVDPWQRTFQAAHWDDPVPSALGTATIGGRSEPFIFAGLDGPPRINAPVRTAGAAQPGSGIVLERSFAQALDIAVGSTIEIPAPTGAMSLTVVGTAVSPSQSRYPRQNPGLGWVSRKTLQRIQPDQVRWRWTQPVRLADPTAAPGVVNAAAAALPMPRPGRAPSSPGRTSATKPYWTASPSRSS